MKALDYTALLLLAAAPALAKPAAPPSVAPTSANAPASAAPESAAGAAVAWTRMPQKAYLCSRHGPDWQLGQDDESVGGHTYASPFVLTVQPGQKVTFTAQAVASDQSAITYTTTGWPDGAVLDPKAGTFQWTAAGTPGRKFPVEVIARSASGAEVKTVLEVVVASEGLQAAWKAGLGGKEWPDCDEREPEQVVTEVDLDGDGRLDVLVSSYWVELNPLAVHPHRWGRHDALVRGPGGDKVLAWPNAWIGDIELAKAPGGGALVVATTEACSGANPVSLYTMRKGAMVSVGAFRPVPSENGEDDGENDDGLAVELVRAADGTVTALQVTRSGETRRLPWHDGTFEE